MPRRRASRRDFRRLLADVRESRRRFSYIIGARASQRLFLSVSRRSSSVPRPIFLRYRHTSVPRTILTRHELSTVPTPIFHPYRHSSVPKTISVRYSVTFERPKDYFCPSPTPECPDAEFSLVTGARAPRRRISPVIRRRSSVSVSIFARYRRSSVRTATFARHRR